MAVTDLAEVTNQIQKVWAPLYTQKLRETLLLGGLVNREYEGEIRQQNDTVYVSQQIDKDAELRVAGVDADAFGTVKAEFTRVALVADQVAIQAYEFTTLAQLQSQVSSANFRDSMVFAINKRINTYLYSLAIASTSNPDHTLNSVSTIDADALADYGALAATAKWPEDGRWVGLLAPNYWATIMKDNDLKSSDFVTDMPTVRGQSARALMGFNCYRDNSITNKAYFFHPDFMYLAMQTELEFKVSDQHANKRLGYLISAHVVFGAKLGIDGSKKLITVSTS